MHERKSWHKQTSFFFWHFHEKEAHATKKKSNSLKFSGLTFWDVRKKKRRDIVEHSGTNKKFFLSSAVQKNHAWENAKLLQLINPKIFRQTNSVEVSLSAACPSATLCFLEKSCVIMSDICFVSVPMINPTNHHIFLCVFSLLSLAATERAILQSARTDQHKPHGGQFNCSQLASAMLSAVKWQSVSSLLMPDLSNDGCDRRPSQRSSIGASWSALQLIPPPSPSAATAAASSQYTRTRAESHDE